MANITLNTILVLRNDTEANWTTNQTTVPKKGEACVSIDKGKIKIGDGVSTWQELKYINATPEELSASGVQNVVVSGTGDTIIDANFSGGVLTITKGYRQYTLSTDNIASNAPNGSITLKNSDGVTESTAAVKGLGSAAFTEATAYDAAGAAKAIQGETSNTVKGVEDLANAAQATANAAIPATEKGANNGVATLDGSGKIPAAQLPASVDEIIEAENFNDLPEDGEESKIYVTLDDNKTYRWGGSSYVEISASIALGETTGTAFDGAKGAKLRTDLDEHTGDAEIHVTASDKTNWNGKTTIAEVEAKGYQTADQVKAIKVNNATNADNAINATNDSEGNPINTTYAKVTNLSATGNNGVTASFSGTALTVGLNLTDTFVLNGGSAAGF